MVPRQPTSNSVQYLSVSEGYEIFICVTTTLCSYVGHAFLWNQQNRLNADWVLGCYWAIVDGFFLTPAEAGCSSN